MYRFVLYYDKDAPYSARVQTIENMLKQTKSKWGVEYQLIEAKSLSSSQVERLKDDVRSTLPQLRGKIVSSKSQVLPLSKTKNPNLTNTPILLLYQDDRSVNVFPHLLGTTYFDIESSLETIAKNGPRAHLVARGLLENPIQKILADAPSILEDGMNFLGAEVEVEDGVIDVLLQDAKGRVVVVEIETKANETAVAQVCRLAADYSSTAKVAEHKIRKVIVCQQFEEKTVRACKGANVELYKLDMKKVT